MRFVPLQLKRWLFLSLVALLPACQAAQQPILIQTESLSSTASAPATASQSTSATESIPERAEESLPSLEPVKILTSDFKDEDFQDLIIFSSRMYGSGFFANFPLDIRWAEGTEVHLFAFSPDGKRAGTLTPPEFASNGYLPSDSSGKPLLVEYGVEFNHPDVIGIELPPECYHPLAEGAEFLACGRFQFSRDGEYLGFFHGPSECLRAIIIQNTQTGIQAYHSMRPNGHYFILPGNGKAIIATGHCQGGGVDYYDLDSRGSIVKSLGIEGQQTWNQDQSAFAVETSPYSGIEQTVWGFNLETEQMFLDVPEEAQIDDRPTWTPDKRYLLYQHRTFTRAPDGSTPTGFDTARQIILVDAQTGEQEVLLSDPAYDFHLGSCYYCAEWHGDWIQIRRVAFSPQTITGGDEIFRSREYQCLISAESCEATVEFFALNWKTGELRPLSDLVENELIPDPSVTETPLAPAPGQQPLFEVPGQYKLYPGPSENIFLVDWRWGGEAGSKFLSGPDLNTDPIYEHPLGLYAYFVGIDGKSLWMVPREGLPLPWVFDGNNYFYVGEK